ncbi:MAG TPA: cell division protein FtsZ [Chthoniobacterales bacterium]|jgi:cell division protein FtsZ
MIEIPRSHPSPPFVPLTRKIVGVGGAGSTVIDRLIIEGLDAADLVAINTDLQALSSTVAAQKILLGHSLTHGLGAGGDPEVGMAAAQDALPELRAAVEGNQIVFITAGLGGGTGSGSAPFMAHAAREAGALVIAIVTLPFTFEGKRRNQQAIAALDHLRQLCHAVICFENDRMSELIAPKAGIQQAFTAADQTMSECLRSILAILARPGIMKVGIDDLLHVLRSDDPRCLFGYGESDSDNRAHEALAYALRNPLMDRAKLLESTGNLLVHVAGSANLTLAEVEILMNELNRHVGDETQLLLGTTIDPRLGQKLAVTLISTVGQPYPLIQTPAALPTVETLRPAAPEVIIPEVAALPALEAEILLEDTPAPVRQTPPARQAGPIGRTPPPAADPKPAATPALEKTKEVKQEVLQFEPVSRGRFEKSEPTIVEGQDLDVPTVLRRGFRI